MRITSESSEDLPDGAETKIYAISSEGGNIIYHVSNQGKVISRKNAEDLRTYALAVGDGGSGTRTSGARVDNELHFDRVNPDDLNLRVNPFGGSQSSLDKVIYEGYEIPPKNKFPELQNVKRLDAETCRKEGIFFDDNEEDGGESQTSPVDPCEEAIEDSEQAVVKKQPIDRRIDSTDAKSTTTEEGGDEASTEDIVSDIIEEILDQIVEGRGRERSRQDSVHSKASMGSKTNSDESTIRQMSMSRDSLGPDMMLGLDGRIDEIDSDTDVDGIGGATRPSGEETPSVHPLHTHLLLYAQKYDSQRTLYALTCLKAILNATPRLVTCAIATTNVTSTDTPHLIQLQNLLVRHRRSVFGKNFYSEAPPEALASYRSSMYVEILLSICLYFMRSYYPNLMMSKLTEQELNGNKEVQILSCEILTLLLSELINVAKDSGKGFATYINDLLSKCKTQKALLHCVLASVYNARRKAAGQDMGGNFTEAIISFNEENMDANTNETFQVC